MLCDGREMCVMEEKETIAGSRSPIVCVSVGSFGSVRSRKIRCARVEREIVDRIVVNFN